MQVLIATLGDSPIVITSATRAFKELRDISIDEVVIVHTENPRVQEAFALIELFFKEIEQGVKVVPSSLGLKDISTTNDSIIFLQRIHSLFDYYKDHELHLLLSGGRKSMSVLMGLMAFFYPNVRGMYHILDRFEGDRKRRNFHLTEDLIDLLGRTDLLKRYLTPPVENVNLFAIPHVSFASVEELRRAIGRQGLEDYSFQGIKINPEQDGFFHAIMTGERPVEIKVAEQAREAFYSFDTTLQKGFLSLIGSLSKKSFREEKDEKNGGMHASFKGRGGVFHVAKRSSMPHRLFWYQQHNQVVICELHLKKGGRSSYDLSSSKFKRNKIPLQTYQPLYDLGLLEGEERVLFATLGQSPLVISQAYRMFKNRGQRIDTIYLICTETPKVEEGAKYLQELFEEEGVKLERKRLPFYDLDSTEHCQSYLRELVSLINRIREEHPSKKIISLLSGGRKGMSILSLFAAQQGGLREVYHTLIVDERLEMRLFRQDQVKTLRNLYNKKERRKYLLLEGYDDSCFSLFRIPVIPYELENV